MNRIRLLKEKPDQEERTSASLGTVVTVRSLKWILLGTVLSVLVVPCGFAAEPQLCAERIGPFLDAASKQAPVKAIPSTPVDQRAPYTPQIPQKLRPQMWSGVETDPKLTADFFESPRWSYPRGIEKNRDGTLRSTRSKDPVQNPPRLTHTAELFCSSWGAGFVRTLDFCEARLLDEHTIQLFVDNTRGAYSDSLRILIRDGRFMCQYWQVYNFWGYGWATKRQRLILDKESYRKGDVIKGRIDLECLDVDIRGTWEYSEENVPLPVRIFGFFKTTVE